MTGAEGFYAINCSKTGNLVDFGSMNLGSLRMAIWREL
jgi:hypothetical protein